MMLNMQNITPAKHQHVCTVTVSMLAYEHLAQGTAVKPHRAVSLTEDSVLFLIIIAAYASKWRVRGVYLKLQYSCSV